MKKAILQILTWLGVMAGCAAVAIIIWMVFFAAMESTASLKWQQFLSSFGMFLVPPIICAYLWNKRNPFVRLKMNKGANWELFLIGIGIILLMGPAVNLLADLNSRIALPKSLESIEHLMQQLEQQNKEIMTQFLQTDTLLINLCLIALLPALGEELTFRGTLQQILGNKHLAIWITAILFGAIHMNYHQFIPLTLMGAMFGYMLLWSGSLWVPIVMHFTNNAFYVILQYTGIEETKIADTLGAGETTWVGVVSLVITSLGLLIFYRRTRRR